MSVPVAMDLVVAVAIGVLATIFFASLVALVVVCGNRYCRKKDLISQQTRDTRWVGKACYTFNVVGFQLKSRTVNESRFFQFFHLVAIV